MTSSGSVDIRFDSNDSRSNSTSTKTSLERSRSREKMRSEIERPGGPMRRQESVKSLQDAMGTLAGQAEEAATNNEPNWPIEWRAYASLFGGFLLMFNSWGLVNTYGTYSSYYMQTLLPGKDLLLLNLVGSTQSFVVLLLSALVGRFLDAGHQRSLITVGTVLLTIGSFTLSVVNGGGGYGEGDYGLIWLTQGFISGLGMACFFVSSSQVVATWFRRRRSFAIGIVASGASIAGLVYPMMDRILTKSVGFNDAQRYVSTVTALTSALAIFIARPNPRHETRPQSNWFNPRIYWDPAAFRNPAFAWLTAAICFMFFGFYAVFFNLEEWAVHTKVGYRDVRDRTENALQTYLLLSIMNASSTIGRLGSSYICDKLHRWHMGALHVHAVVMFIAALLLLILWTMADSVAAAVSFVVVFGVFSGAVIGLPPASVAYILELDPEGQTKLGQWTGMMYTSASVFALTGPVIAGHLITEYGDDFRTVQLWSGFCLLLSAGCMGMAGWYRRKAFMTQMTLTAASTTASEAPVMHFAQREKDVEAGPN